MLFAFLLAHAGAGFAQVSNEFLSELSVSQRDYLNSIDRITFCIDPDWMPFEAVVDGKLTGMSSNIIALAEQTLQVKFDLVVTHSLTESLRNVVEGTCELLPLLSITEERIQFLDYTEPYLYYSGGIIAQENLPFISGLQDLKNSDVAIVRDSAIWDYVAINHPENKRLIAVDSVEQGLLKLSSGNVAAFLVALPVGAYHIKRLGLTNLKVAGHTDIRRALRVAVGQQHLELLPIIQRLVLSFSQEEIDSIYNQWLSIRFEHRFDQSLLWKLGFGVALLALIFLYRYRVISSFNQRLITLSEELEATNKVATNSNRQLGRANEALENSNAELELLSQTDSLTALYNRRFISEKANAELQLLKRYPGIFSIILLDLDHFKQINDVHGHAVGDRVLKAMAKILETRVRKTDLVGRWGGEEFIVICPRTGAADAYLVAESIRVHIEQETEFFEKVTASFGIAEYRATDSLDRLIARADEGLYIAKAEGRNRVCQAPV